MGCKNSKGVQVAPVLVKQSPNSAGLLDGKTRASAASLRLSGDRPSGSATSKVSKHSHDSGYSGHEETYEGCENEIDEYAGIITEESDMTVVQEIEKDFVERDLDFCLMGTPAPRNLSAKDKARLDEQRILEDLRNEGLIATSKFEAKSGLAFEVVEATNLPRRVIPARLAKLEKKKKKKKTKEDIDKKLALAEQRRKEAEQEKLEKINAVTTKSDTTHVQEDLMKHQQELLESTLKKVDAVAEKREQMLREKREKQKAREEHAQKVRSRRKLHIPTEEELQAMEAQAKAMMSTGAGDSNNNLQSEKNSS